MDSDDFFDQGGDRPEIVAGRYRLPHPETGVEQSWTRATTHAELPEDSFALTRYQLRQLLIGLWRRPDLLRLIESWPDEPGRDELDQVAATAHEVAGNDVKANLGTAIHGVLQQVDRAWPVPSLPADDEWLARVLRDAPDWAGSYVSNYVAELRRHGLRPIPTMTERRVVNLDLGCAGTIDNLYEEADGTVALGDKKTGRLDYPERKYAIQLAVYLGSSHLLDPDGGPPIDLKSLGLRREYAVLVYVDPDSGSCSIYRVDMRRGQLGANLAADVRAWRRERHLLLPYVAPNAFKAGAKLQLVPAPVKPSDSLAPFATEMQRDQFDQHYARQPGVITADALAMTDAVPALPPAEQVPVGPEHVNPGTHAVSGGLVDDEPSNKSLLSEAELMRLTKAQVQQYGRERGVTDLAHNKPQLMPIYAKAGILAGGAPPKIGPDPATGRPGVPGTRAMSIDKDPAELPAGPATATAEDPTDPHSQAFHRARLAEIAGAASVGVLGRIHAFVTRVGGDQAWTDAMTEAARSRTAELDAAESPHASPVDTIEWAGKVAPVDAVIAEVASSQEMAQVWSLVTVGGSLPDKWTPERNELAHARLAWLDSQTPAPSTPFGPTQ